MVKRVPIKIKRTPILLPDFIKGQAKLWELMEETREEDILEIADHFNMLVMQTTLKAGYNSLSLTNPTEHKNWIHFERVYEICRMKGWDAKLYVESQFERAKGWKQMKYPLPQSMYSMNALFFFTNYLTDTINKYAHDTRGEEKLKGKETKTIKQDILDGILRSVEKISDTLKSTKQTDSGQAKALTIFQTWAELSPYYLYSVPWFHDVIKELSGKLADRVTDEFTRIDSSSMMKDIIADSVKQVEKYYEVPENINF